MSHAEFQNHYGPVALVTGASSGIGKSFAQLLAARGLDLVLVAPRVERLEALASRLQGDHDIEVTVCQADLCERMAAAQILEATLSLDIGLIISNAGFGVKGEYASGDAGTLADMLMVNCNTPMLLAHGFLPRLRARCKGGIIFTSSVEGLIPCPFSTAYAATKGFLNSLGQGLWGELAQEEIDVLTLCPGATDTEALVLQGIDPSTLDDVMTPDEVAELTLAHIKNGPVYIPSAHYEAMFDALLSMPRGDALLAMADNMKQEI